MVYLYLHILSLWPLTLSSAMPLGFLPVYFGAFISSIKCYLYSLVPTCRTLHPVFSKDMCFKLSEMHFRHLFNCFINYLSKISAYTLLFYLLCVSPVAKCIHYHRSAPLSNLTLSINTVLKLTCLITWLYFSFSVKNTLLSPETRRLCT